MAQQGELWYKQLGFFNNPFSIKPAAFHFELVGYDIDEIFSKVELGSAIYVKGEMGVGKTTMLKIIITKFGGKKKVIYTSANVSDRKISFKKLLARTSFWNNLFSIAPKGMILLVDEAQELKKSESSEIYRLLKKGNFKSVIFFGTDYVEEKFDNRLNALLKGNVKLLQRLKPENAVELVRKRIGDLPALSDGAIKKIYKLSLQNPRKLLENCEDVIKYALESGDDKVTEKHIKAVIKVPVKPNEAQKTIQRKSDEPQITISHIEEDVPLEPLREIKEGEPLKPSRKKKAKTNEELNIRTYEEEMQTLKQQLEQ